MTTPDPIALPELPPPYQGQVVATSRNTSSVRKGVEMGGYIKSPELFTADQMHAYGRACVEALPPAPQVPEGMVLVPRVATDEMIGAAWDSDAADYVGEHKRIHSLGLAWAAMLSAAPQQPEDECEACGRRSPLQPAEYTEALDMLGNFNPGADEFTHALEVLRQHQPQQPAEAVAVDPVEVEAVAVFHADEDGGHIDWLLEGGSAEMCDGDVLCVLSQPRLVENDGHVTLHKSPPPAIDIGKSGKESGRADNLVSHMVQRFLGWRLPENFGPDCGIKFERLSNVGTEWERQNEPTGTNLLDAEQAKAMFAYCIEGHDAEEDYYVIQRLSNLLAQIAVAVNGPEPPLTRWSYHDLPEKVRALKTIDIGKLRELVERWRTEAERLRKQAGRTQRRGNDGLGGAFDALELQQAAQDTEAFADELAALIGDGGEAGNG